MDAENLRTGARIDLGVFGPEDVAVLRASLDQAWNALPRERRTPENMDAMATAIVRSATFGERERRRRGPSPG